MFGMSHLQLESVEIKSIPATYTPYRREMVLGFSENEFSDFIDTVREGTITKESIQTFCDKFGSLGPEPRMPGSQVGGFEEPKTVMVLKFKDTTKETITQYFSITGLLDDFDLSQPIPDFATFTPTSYWEYMVINDTALIPGSHVGVYNTLRGFDAPLVVATPGSLLEQRIVNTMIAGDYFGETMADNLCSLSPIKFSLSQNDSPSTYLLNLIKAAIKAREYVANNHDNMSDPLLGIHDCAQYLMSAEVSTRSNPFMLMFDYSNMVEIRTIREEFSNFDDVIKFTAASRPCYLTGFRPLGTYGIEETMAQELTLDALGAMSEVALRELHIRVDPVTNEWIPTVFIPKWNGASNPEQIAQKVCKRLSEQFFTKYREILSDIPMVLDLKFDVTGISEVYINSRCREEANQQVLGFAFPTYNVPGWSHVLMSSDNAAGLSEYVYQYIDMLINA